MGEMEGNSQGEHCSERFWLHVDYWDQKIKVFLKVNLIGCLDQD